MRYRPQGGSQTLLEGFLVCDWGDNVTLRVPMHQDDSHTGKFRWANKGVDRCIAPIIAALNGAGVYTRGCCCGHGKGDGKITLHDGRILVVKGAAGD